MVAGPALAAAISAAAQQPAGNASLRIGVVTAYQGGTISVDVGGGSLVQAAYGSRYNPAVGDVVYMLSAGATWVVVDSLASTPGQFVPQVAEVPTNEGTTSGAYTDLATVGPQVTAVVGNSGRVLVLYSGQLGWIELAANSQMGGDIGIDVSGANVIAPAPDQRLRIESVMAGTDSNLLVVSLGGMKFFTGLNPGTTTFKLMYRTLHSPKQVDFDNRMIAVLPQ